MKYIWVCDCHWEMHSVDNPTKPPWPFGSVVQCQNCKEVFGRLIPQGGGSEWVRISSDQVEFHGLLENLDEVENESFR